MRLIDAELLQKTYCDENCGDRKCVDAMDRCTFIDAVISAPTVEAVPMSVIEDIKAKINTSNRGTCDYQIVDNIEKIIEHIGGKEQEK